MGCSKKGNWKNKHQKSDNIGRLKFEGKLTNDHKETADTFNKFFISVAKNIITKNNHNDSGINDMEKKKLHPFTICCNALSVPFQINLSCHQLGKLGL